MLPNTQQPTLIAGPAGDLEILATCPLKTSTLPMPYAVVCHPHPLYGGTLTNKVVYIITQTFNALGLGTIRFNFRGVGNSTGKFDNGDGETEDLQAVVDWIRTRYAPPELWLAGFSFGSYIALRGHHELKANRLLLVAPPVERFQFNQLALSHIPTLVIQGEQDTVVSPQAVSDWIAIQKYQPQMVWIAEADHFFHGKLSELRKAITATWNSPLS